VSCCRWRAKLKVKACLCGSHQPAPACIIKCPAPPLPLRLLSDQHILLPGNAKQQSSPVLSSAAAAAAAVTLPPRATTAWPCPGMSAAPVRTRSAGVKVRVLCTWCAWCGRGRAPRRQEHGGEQAGTMHSHLTAAPDSQGCTCEGQGMYWLLMRCKHAVVCQSPVHWGGLQAACSCAVRLAHSLWRRLLVSMRAATVTLLSLLLSSLLLLGYSFRTLCATTPERQTCLWWKRPGGPPSAQRGVRPNMLAAAMPSHSAFALLVRLRVQGFHKTVARLTACQSTFSWLSMSVSGCLLFR